MPPAATVREAVAQALVELVKGAPREVVDALGGDVESDTVFAVLLSVCTSNGVAPVIGSSLADTQSIADAAMADASTDLRRSARLWARQNSIAFPVELHENAIRFTLRALWSSWVRSGVTDDAAGEVPS